MRSLPGGRRAERRLESGRMAVARALRHGSSRRIVRYSNDAPTPAVQGTSGRRRWTKKTRWRSASRRA
jgi:hypothetical protein